MRKSAAKSRSTRDVAAILFNVLPRQTSNGKTSKGADTLAAIPELIEKRSTTTWSFNRTRGTWLQRGFLLSIALSLVSSANPLLSGGSSPKYLHSRPNPKQIAQHYVGTKQFNNFVPGIKSVLCLRGGSESMGLTVPVNNAQLSMNVMVPALMSSDNSIRSKAEVRMPSCVFVPALRVDPHIFFWIPRPSLLCNSLSSSPSTQYFYFADAFLHLRCCGGVPPQRLVDWHLFCQCDSTSRKPKDRNRARNIS